MNRSNPPSTIVLSPTTLLRYRRHRLLTDALRAVMVVEGEVAAENFVLNIGHLVGRQEPVVQPAISNLREGGSA